MAKCANCDRDAEYRYVTVEPFGTNYCRYDLPSFLNAARDQGILPAPVDEEGKSSKKKKSSEPVVEEESVTEEPVVEDAPEEEVPAEEPSGE